MATFTGTSSGDTANAVTGTLTGFTGGTVAELQDGIGDQFTAGAGDDLIVAGSGDDFVNGGAGADNLDGGAGNDTLSYASSNAPVVIDLNTKTFLYGHANGDVATGFENVEGSPFADSLTGTTGANILWGFGGNDTINGLQGDDLILGGDGADLLLGSFGVDAIFGEDGNDTIIGGPGADTLDGGPGLDTLSYSNSPSAVQVNLLEGTASGGDAQGDTFTGFEILRGSAFNDGLVGDTGRNTIFGGPGADTIVGAAGDDILYGEEGNDTFIAGPGADQNFGGAGIDTVDYSASSAGVTLRIGGISSGGLAQGDILTTIENLIGTQFDDTIIGSNLPNQLSGLGGDDLLIGGPGADSLVGGGGNDVIVGGQGADAIFGGAGVDTASYFSSVNGVTIDLAAGTASGGDATGDVLQEIENLVGSNTGNDRLYGNAGTNVLEGFGGSDWLRGGGGNDIIRLGDDTVQDRAIYDADNFGNDFVGQFHDEEDILDMRGLGLTFDDVDATQVGNTTTLTFAGITGQITLTQFYAADITASDFFF